jgi:hypothetical protein
MDSLGTVQYGKKWHRSLWKSVSGYSSPVCLFLKSPAQLHMRNSSSRAGVGDGVVWGGSDEARHERSEFDIALGKKAGEISAKSNALKRLVNIRQRLFSSHLQQHQQLRPRI